jgi:hypothetical protein
VCRSCRRHFETLLTAAPPVAVDTPRITVADVNFGVNNSECVDRPSPLRSHWQRRLNVNHSSAITCASQVDLEAEAPRGPRSRA